MSYTATPVTPAVYEYMLERGVRRDDVLERLARETDALGDISRMRIAAEQCAFLEILVRAIGARQAIEIGTFTGSSSISIARGLGERGRLLCCDVSEKWTAIAKRYWAEAGVTSRIDLRLAPALETIRSLPSDATFDFAFLDADKSNYVAYYEALLPRLRTGGLLLVDNVLWSGKVADPSEQAPETRAIRALNQRIHEDPAVDAVLMPISDGLTIARKR